MSNEILILKNYNRENLFMLTGKLLGDGCITRQEGRKPRFQFIHRIEDKDWCLYCYQKLKVLVPLCEPKYKKVYDKRLVKGFSESFYVQSKTDKLITLMEKVWYINRKKRIPFSFLHYCLDELCLAWWYQDDGHLKIDNNIPNKIILSTDSFLPNENDQLIKLLENKFHLIFTRDSQNRLVLYDQLQIYYFLHLVKKHIQPSMARKLPQFNTDLQSLRNRRTSIYLPANLQLTKPTKEINTTLLNSLEFLLPPIEGDFKKFYLENIPRLKKVEQTKSYQIILEGSIIGKLEWIKRISGLNFSQSATLCFLLHNESLIPKGVIE